jgi:hypothetical protein
MCVDSFHRDAGNFGSGAVIVTGKKGALSALANNDNHDERRFGELLRFLFARIFICLDKP